MDKFLKIPVTYLLANNKKLFYQLVDEDGKVMEATDIFHLQRSYYDAKLLFQIGKTFKRKKKYSEHFILDNLQIESCEYHWIGSIDVKPSFEPREATEMEIQYSDEEIKSYNLKIEQRIEKEHLRRERQQCEEEILALEKKIDTLDEKLGRTNQLVQHNEH